MRRLVEAQELDLGEKGLGWWSYHLDRFLQYCRDRGEQIEVKLLARGFYDSLSQAEPPVSEFRVDQTKQALTAFVRGIEDWHWVEI